MAEVLDNLREAISQYLKKADFEGAGVAISKAVPSLLRLSVDEWEDVDIDGVARTAGLPIGNRQQPETPSKEQSQVSADPGETANEGESSSSGNSSGDSDDHDDDDDSSNDDDVLISSYLYRSTIHLPRNPRLEHLCTWLYDTVVRADSEEEPEEQACQKLPAAILAAWRRLQQQQQLKQAQIQLQQGQGGELGAAGNPATNAAAAAAAVLPPTEALHLQHSAFSAPYCTWRHVAPDALPPLHDVLVGVLRVCWDRHNDRDPSRNIIWGAQRHSRRDDPVTAYLYIEYLRLVLVSIIKSRAEPLWLWHELQEVIEEYPHWRYHPHEVAVLARMMAEHGCGWLMLNTLMDHIGKAPLLMYGAWASLWDGLRRSEARACCRMAAKYGVPLDAVWVHVAELTLLQVKEHPRDPRLLARAGAVLTRVLAFTPAPAELASLLRAERDAPGSCEGVRHVTSQLQLDELLVENSIPTF
ncbi:hypothetical protein VaNZ11_016333 [Volvox africanus]|uniref:Uncharacterized protein n=1 Tax=Volvox africanus TaxID=51714 RepID=A0ABQ5SNZ9_9CHLO|nr:hypothetical protein VaNZ11_016333 [Volvox africanus]